MLEFQHRLAIAIAEIMQIKSFSYTDRGDYITLYLRLQWGATQVLPFVPKKDIMGMPLGHLTYAIASLVSPPPEPFEKMLLLGKEVPIIGLSTN